MKKTVLTTAIATILASNQAFSGNADVFLFLENSPLQGAEVAINGEIIGETNDKGETSTFIAESGDHKISILRNGEELLLKEFSLLEEQDVEISVVLSTTDEPLINFYKSGDNEANAVGFLAGQIRNTAQEPIENALVSIEGSDLTATTDASGNYKLELPRGNYKLEVHHSEYSAASLDGIRIVANVGTAAVVTLQARQQNASGPEIPFSGPLEDVLVLGHFNATQDSAFTLEQMSTSVVDAIDMEQIIRFGDSNVASALKRVVGVAIVDGKYAVVRGLDGRYIASTLNKNLMPTTNAFKRDAELDLFPADILSGIEIKKSFTADLPADSTAGTILVKTQDMPDEPIHKISASIGYNLEVTGEDMITYEGGDSDFWGFDDGTRERPGSLYAASNQGLDFSICQIAGQQNCVQPDQAAALASSLENTWNIKTETASPDFDLSYALGGSKEFASGSLAGYATVSFDKEHKSKVDAFQNNPVGTEGDFQEDSTETSLNAYGVFGFEFNDGAKIQSKTTFLRNTDNTARLFDGFDNSEENTFQEVNLEWKEREFFGQHLFGTHVLFNDHDLNWRIGIGITNSDIPDRRSYTYFGDFLSFSTVERMWGELTEDATDLGLDYAIPLEFGTSWRTDIKTGFLYNFKDRENEIVRFGIRPGSNPIRLNEDLETLLAPQNFENDAFRLNAITTDTDRYTAEQETSAFYVATETHYNELFTFVVGFRYETFEQEFELPNSDETVPNVDESDVYPSIAFVYRPNEKWQIRTAVSETVSRPTLTERAPALFYDDKSDEFFGNPDLINSDITNLDFRVDYYFEDEGNISFALFHKSIDNPVEVGVADGSGSANSAFTWRNENEATIQGIELDISKQFFNNGAHEAFIGSNITLIDSEVTLSDDSQRLQLDDKRELQGQSPALANIQLGYDHVETDQKATLLVNYFDDRIYQVTRSPEEVIFEAGRLTLDFNYEIGFNDGQSSLKVKVKNLTNEDVEFVQNGRTIEGWNNGTKISVGYSYNF